MQVPSRQTMVLFYAIGASVILAGVSADAASQRALPVWNAQHHIAPSAALPPAMRRHVRHDVQGGKQRDAKHPPFVFTAQYWGNDIEIYRLSGSTLDFFGSMTAGLANPQGIYVAPPSLSENSVSPTTHRPPGAAPHAGFNGGDLYVANSSASNVLVFSSTRKGPMGPVAILGDSGQYPDDVAVSLDRGLVAVSNQIAVPFGSGSVSIYANGATSPTSTLSVPGDVEGMGVAFDRAGNCYWSLNTLEPHGGQIVEFSRCAGKAKTIITGLGYAGGIAFDRYDDLFYTDQMAGVYHCTKNASCAQISATFGDPVYLNFGGRWGALWVSDADGFIDEVDPTTGSLQLSEKTAGGAADPPIGIAAAPGSRY